MNTVSWILLCVLCASLGAGAMATWAMSILREVVAVLREMRSAMCNFSKETK